MKMKHATFTDALQIVLSIDGGNNWREQIQQLALPKGWSIAMAVESALIFDVGFIDPWVTAGVHHDLVMLGLRTPAMLSQKAILQNLADTTWQTYERAIDSDLDSAVRETAWRHLEPLVDHALKSRLHLQGEWAHLAPIVNKFNARRGGAVES